MAPPSALTCEAEFEVSAAIVDEWGVVTTDAVKLVGGAAGVGASDGVDANKDKVESILEGVRGNGFLAIAARNRH